MAVAQHAHSHGSCIPFDHGHVVRVAFNRDVQILFGLWWLCQLLLVKAVTPFGSTTMLPDLKSNCSTNETYTFPISSTFTVRSFSLKFNSALLMRLFSACNCFVFSAKMFSSSFTLRSRSFRLTLRESLSLRVYPVILNGQELRFLFRQRISGSVCHCCSIGFVVRVQLIIIFIKTSQAISHARYFLQLKSVVSCASFFHLIVQVVNVQVGFSSWAVLLGQLALGFYFLGQVSSYFFFMTTHDEKMSIEAMAGCG